MNNGRVMGAASVLFQSLVFQLTRVETLDRRNKSNVRKKRKDRLITITCSSLTH